MRTGLVFFLIFISLFNSSFSQSFTHFIDALNYTSKSEKLLLIDSFFKANDVFPIIEDSTAHFIYYGEGSNPHIAGDFTNWDPANGPMTNIDGTNFWYRSEIFNKDARLDYKIVHSESNWILDPLNDKFAPSGHGNNSELSMPNYLPPYEIKFNAKIEHGTIVDTLFQSSNLNNSRLVKVYLPSNYKKSKEKYPLILVNDGLEYLELAKMNNVLDLLIHEEKIPPLIAIFIPPVDRTEEYCTNKQLQFSKFIVDEIMPWVDYKYRTKSTAKDRAIIGSSYGGNISLWIASHYPTVFGKVGVFSPFVEEDILDIFNNVSYPIGLKMYINHGTYDHLDLIHQSVNSFVPLLQKRKYNYLYEAYNEGHSYGLWRAHLDDALIYLFKNN